MEKERLRWQDSQLEERTRGGHGNGTAAATLQGARASAPGDCMGFLSVGEQ